MKENRFVSWVCMHPFWSTVIALLLFVVGIPVLINLCYSCAHVFYVTQWGAEDVLAYYGTILGASIAALSLVITIRFTRKQIERENFIRSELEKWKGAESVIDKALVDICPLNMTYSLVYSEKSAEILLMTIDKEQKYMLNTKQSLDGIKLYLNPNDFQLIKNYVDLVLKNIENYCEISTEISKPYQEMYMLLIEKGIVSTEIQKLYLDRASVATQKILDEHLGSYQVLLNAKRDLFYQIYQDIYKKADQKLKLFNGSVDECQPSNGSEKRK